MKRILPVVAILLFSSCVFNRLQINDTQKRGKNKIKGEPNDFLTSLNNAKTIDKASWHGDYALVMIKERDGKNSLYLQAFKKKREDEPVKYERTVWVNRLSKDTASFALDPAKVKAHLTDVPLTKICDAINNSGVADGRYMEVYGTDSNSNPVKYFRGVFIERAPCNQSELLPIEVLKGFPPMEGYANSLVHCIPGTKFGLLVKITNGKPELFNQKDTVPATSVKKEPEVKDSFDVSFPYRCPCGDAGGLRYFTVSINTHKNGKIVITDQKTLIPGAATKLKIPIATKDTSVKVDPFDKVTIASDTSVKGKSINIAFSPGNQVVYPFNYGYEPFNYYSIFSWLKMTYPGLDCDCLNQLAYMISDQVMLHDSAYLNRLSGAGTIPKATAAATATATTTTATPAKDDAKTKSAFVKSGSVKIANTSATVLHPVYKSNTKIFPQIIPVQLQVFGSYDSAANQISFALRDDSALANKIKLYDTVITLQKREWDQAITNGGVYPLALFASTKAVKDSVTDLQTAFVLIKGQPENGSHEIQLTPSVFDNTQNFWVEVGANFDLLDGIQANNLYTGVYMFEKDIAKLGRYRKHNNVSFIGGVYESKSSSISQFVSANDRYADNTSFVPVTGRGYPYYRDTGNITITTEVKSVGLFLSPLLRLTDKSITENGFHVFASFYAEMLWQRVKTNNDYSQAARVETFYSVDRNIFDSIPIRVGFKNEDFKSHYLGIGLPLYIKHDNFNLYINHTYGFTTQKFAALSADVKDSKAFNPKDKAGGYAPPIHHWNPFYLFQFRLNEEHYGISFTGEMRGFFLKGTKSVISLALSKKFNLDALMSNIVAPFSGSKP